MNFGTNFFSEPLGTVIRLAAAVTVFENNQKCPVFKVISHCLKITQNVAFEFLNFDIFHQFLSY